MKNLNRFVELDVWRGLCVVGMIIFHAFFLLNYYGTVEVELFQGWWHVFGQAVRIGFLLLVGISMVISYNRAIDKGLNVWQAKVRQMKRSVVVFGAAFAVSIGTYAFSPGEFVRFGILHLIATSILLLSLVVDKKWWCCVIGALVFVVGQFFVWPVFAGAFDNFPVFPWLSVVAFGICVGHFSYAWLKSNSWRENLAKLNFLKPVLFLGRHSLAVYLLHVPFLLFIFWLFDLVLTD